MLRKIFPLMIGILLISLFTGCDLANFAYLPSGTIMIRIPENSSSRGSIDTAYASSNSDYYEAFIFNEDELISTSITSSGQTISVPVGVYNVVVFAGKHIASDSRCLLGSGNASNVEILEGQQTDITIQLITPNITLDAPEEVVTNTNFEFNYYGCLNNPYLLLSDSSNAGSYYLSGEGEDLTVRYFENATIAGDSFAFTESLVAPALPKTFYISISRFSIYLYISGEKIVETKWGMPDYAYSNLDGISEITVDIVDDPLNRTGLGITIEW